MCLIVFSLSAPVRNNIISAALMNISEGE